MQKNIDSVKWVTLGDASVGKTSILTRISDGAFPEQQPTANDFVKEVVVDGNRYIVKFWDLNGGEQYHSVRPLAYPGTDIFVLCFDKSQRPSFDNVKETWIPEIRHHMPDTPILLVGNKVDLISNGNSSSSENQDKSAVVTRQEACELAQSIGGSCIEASAVTGEQVSDVLVTAIRMVVRHRNRRRANCRCRPILKWFRSMRHR